MTRGTNFLNKSKCRCGLHGKTNRPYGTKGGVNYYLKGHCPSCNKVKSLPFTQAQLDVEGEGIKKFFKKVYNKVLKPVGTHVGKNIISNPMRALQVGTQLGMAAASRNPKMIMNAGMQAGKFGATGKGIKIGELTQGGALYLYKK